MILIAEERIRHNGKVFEKGEEVKGLAKKDEKRLLDLRKVKKLDFSAEPQKTKLSPEKALDKKYTRDLLVEVATNAGVNFPEDATKAVIIAAIIEQGKAEELLNDEGE